MEYTFPQNLLQRIIFLLLIFTPNFYAFSPNIVKSIPGFPGNLPFYLETGYVGVGDNEEVQLFYYFIKSERDYAKDPLMIWLTGCSALSGLVLEIGPLIFNTSACDWHSEAPTFQLNQFSWTKIANVIFLDSPAGAGFSYATSSKGYYSDDITSSRHIYQFLRKAYSRWGNPSLLNQENASVYKISLILNTSLKWLMDHHEFQTNPLFVTGESYCGKIVPIVVHEIFYGNKAGIHRLLNLQGYILGNPLTRENGVWNKSKIDYAHRVSLLSDDLYESTNINCNGTYEDVDNVKCARNLQAISYNLDPLFDDHVLRPKCISAQTWCQWSIYHLLENWANDIQVRKALHIQEGTKGSWMRCNFTLAYEQNVKSTFGYHQNLTRDYIRALIYSGDQDMKVPYVGTLEWIKMLNVAILYDWRPWVVDGQVAGYTMMFSNDKYNVTFATVKGAGHTAPEYKRSECFSMISKWFAMLPL